MVRRHYDFLEVLGAFLSALDDVDTDIMFGSGIGEDDSAENAWPVILPHVLAAFGSSLICSDLEEEASNRQYAKDFLRLYEYPAIPSRFAVSFCDRLGYEISADSVREYD